jgi:hypothetical protein
MAPRMRMAVGGVLFLLIAGCGSDSEPAKSTAHTPKTTASPAIENYLLKDDEVPDLKPVESPQTDTGEPFDLPADGVKRLKRSGYISTTYQPADGNNGAGVSSVLLFKTAAGARDWMAYEISDAALKAQLPDSALKPFKVPDIPGATGWTGPDLHGNSIGQIYWTQGRCMMTIGLEVEGPRVERLIAGAKAIYERTGHTCPG